MASKQKNHDYLEKNYEAFEAMEFSPGHAGKWAVIGKCKLIGVFDTMSDADKIGGMIDPKEEYIVQQVGNVLSVDLAGYQSRDGMASTAKQKEYPYLEENYKAFEAMDFSPDQTGKWAVIGKCKLIGVFDTRSDADKIGGMIDPKEEYIVQQIGRLLIDLGILSRNGFTGF